MVTIRLARGGAKKRPFYHIVVADSRRSRDGRFIERIGYYNPVAARNETKLTLDSERLSYWLSQGAKPSERVNSLAKQNAAAAA
jgi:small subunit ribosomal protein S16